MSVCLNCNGTGCMRCLYGEAVAQRDAARAKLAATTSALAQVATALENAIRDLESAAEVIADMGVDDEEDMVDTRERIEEHRTALATCRPLLKGDQ